MNDPNRTAARWSGLTMRSVAPEDTLAGAALRYANLEIPIFPCFPGGKRPLTSNGFHDATSSAKTVNNWWQRDPEANRPSCGEVARSQRC